MEDKVDDNLNVGVEEKEVYFEDTSIGIFLVKEGELEKLLFEEILVKFEEEILSIF